MATRKLFSMQTLLLVVLLIIGCIAVYFVSLRSKNSTFELRSKAAEGERIIKIWEFKDAAGKDTAQSWIGKGITSVKANDGFLTGFMPTKQSNLVELSNHTYGGSFSAGFKFLSFRMTMETPDGATLPDDLFPFSVPIVVDFFEYDRTETGVPPYGETSIYVKLIPSLRSKATIFIDGSAHDYVITMPPATSIRAYPIRKIVLSFPDFYKYSKAAPMQIKVDWIKLGVVPTKPGAPDCSAPSESCSVVQ